MRHKTFITTLVAMLFIAGCVDYSYAHKTYYQNGKVKESLEIKGSKAMVNDEKTGLIIRLADGTELHLDHVDTDADPNSISAFADPIEAWNGTKLIKSIKLLKGNQKGMRKNGH